MGRKILFTATIGIEIDESDWADEYGLATDAVPADAIDHLTEYVRETVKQSGLGYLFESVAVRVPRTRVKG